MKKYHQKPEKYNALKCPYENRFSRMIKFSNKISLEGSMHIYEYGMLQYVGVTNKIELGACDDLFSPYFEKMGFNKTIGMLALTLRYNPLLFLIFLFNKKKLLKAIIDWLEKGDFHTCVINMIHDHPNKSKYEEALRKLECRIIRNSIIAGIKDEHYWQSEHIITKLIISNQELIDSLAPLPLSTKNAQKDYENQRIDFVPSREDMEPSELSQQIESEKTDGGGKENHTSFKHSGKIYNNCIFTICQIINYNQNIFIKNEYNNPRDNYHTEQPKETRSPIQECEPSLSEDVVPTENQTMQIPMEEQSQCEIKEEATDSQQVGGELREQIADAINVPQKSLAKRNKGRKAAFSSLKDKSLFGLIDSFVNPNLNVDTWILSTKIMSKIKDCQDDKAKAPLIVALEVCGIIPILESDKVKGFCELLCKKHDNLVQYRTFINHYKSYARLREKARQQSQALETEAKLKEILDWKDSFYEMLKNTKKSEEK